MTDYSRYFDLVQETHVEIEGWFCGLEPGVLPTLLARFSAQFSMITPSGNTLNLSSMEALFEQLRGARPGLVITLSEFQGIALYAGGGHRLPRSAGRTQRQPNRSAGHRCV